MFYSQGGFYKTNQLNIHVLLHHNSDCIIDNYKRVNVSHVAIQVSPFDTCAHCKNNEQKTSRNLSKKSISILTVVNDENIKYGSVLLLVCGVRDGSHVETWKSFPNIQVYRRKI